MKKQISMTVESVRKVALDTFEMTLNSMYLANTARPGQFLHLQVAGHTLRRPLSIANIEEDGGTVTILFRTTGGGTAWLSTRQPGEKLDAIGPAGNGFSYDVSIDTALLIGGGIGIPPLYYLGKELRKNDIYVKAVLGYQSKEQVFYEDKFQEVGDTYIVTDDGSYGFQGNVTGVLDKVGHYDHYFSCGPVPMLKAVTKTLHDYPGSISLEERMGCGIGACFACVIPADTTGNYRKICSDGPVFDAGEVML